jgi:hypothetical protein
MGVFGRFFKPDIKKMERKGDVEGLIKALKYEDLDVRMKAEDALARIGGPGDVKRLFNVFRDKEEDRSVRYAAMRSLKKMRWSEVVDFFIKVLKDKGEDIDVREGVAEALGEVGGQKGREALMEVFKDKEEDVRLRHSAEYSFKIERIANPYSDADPKVVESLIKVLIDKSENRKLRVMSTHVLEQISRGRGSCELMLRSFPSFTRVIEDEDDDPLVRHQAKWALGRVAGWLKKHPQLVRRREKRRQEDLGLRQLFQPEDHAEIARVRAVEEDTLRKRRPEFIVLSFKWPKKCPKCGSKDFTFAIDYKCFRCERCGTLIESEENSG